MIGRTRTYTFNLITYNASRFLIIYLLFFHTNIFIRFFFLNKIVNRAKLAHIIYEFASVEVQNRYTEHSKRIILLPILQTRYSI